MHRHSCIRQAPWVLAAVLCLGQVFPAIAQTGVQPILMSNADNNALAAEVASALHPSSRMTATGPAPPVAIIDALGPAIAAEQLQGLRGGTDSSESVVIVDGDVTGNTAEGVFSGSNLIDNGFNQASGISTVIQNTGSNVLIQNGMALNVQFTAPVP